MADDSDLLLYALNGADSGSFKIDRTNGQITNRGEVRLRVQEHLHGRGQRHRPLRRSDSILVTINVTDENDPAVISGVKAIDYAENGADPVATFTASDQDGDAIAWSLGGGRRGPLLHRRRFLAFKKSPDYEDSKPSRRAPPPTGTSTTSPSRPPAASRPLPSPSPTSTKTGKVTFSKQGQFQPQAGRTLEASLADQDGGVTDEKWQWARSSDMETWTDIDGATSGNRSPVADDVGSYLRASVSYTDSFGSGKSASAVTENAVEARTVANAAPSFKDQDDNDPQNANTTPAGIQINRTVDENSEAGSPVGKPVPPPTPTTTCSSTPCPAPTQTGSALTRPRARSR